MSIWTEQEDKFFADNYGKLSAKEIAAQLNRSVHSIYHRAEVRGIQNTRWEDLRGYSHLSDAQKGWIAGILDGEGWVGCDKRSRRITIQVNNTDLKMIAALQLMCGGSKYPSKKPRNDKWRQQYVWVLSRRENVLNLLTSVYPYLITKREAANRAFLHVGREVPFSS